MPFSSKMDDPACYRGCSQSLCSLVWRIDCVFQTTQPSICATVNCDFIYYVLVPHYAKWSVSSGCALFYFIFWGEFKKE